MDRERCRHCAEDRTKADESHRAMEEQANESENVEDQEWPENIGDAIKDVESMIASAKRCREPLSQLWNSV